jgi:hypothetical protein
MKSNLVIVLRRSSDAFGIIGEICGRDGIVHDFDPDLGVLEATLPAEHVHGLHALPAIAYVRPVLTYCPAAAA